MERNSKEIIILVIFAFFLLYSKDVQGQNIEGLNKNEYIVDTVTIYNPITVIHSKKGQSISLYMPESKLKNYTVMDDSIFLVGDYIFNPSLNHGCVSNHWINKAYQYRANDYYKFKLEKLTLVISVVSQEYYIKRTSSVEYNNLKMFFPKNNKYILVGVPLCIE